mmetsp:Transcript_3942/g.8583  ORF Transcript_3942/g.8583 Transcript_3942/m.8583 type:complete len:122 (-) Transcript_3942:197-562(-)
MTSSERDGEVRSRLRARCHNMISDEEVAMLATLVAFDPRRRPSAAACLELPYVKQCAERLVRDEPSLRSHPPESSRGRGDSSGLMWKFEEHAQPAPGGQAVSRDILRREMLKEADLHAKRR